MNPLKHKLANEWMRQDDASPEEALETWNTMEAEFKLNRAMLQEPRTVAQEPRNMAQGGQIIGKPGGLVEPGVEYYATSKVKTDKFKYPGGNRHGKWWSDKPEPAKLKDPEYIKILKEKISAPEYKDKNYTDLIKEKVITDRESRALKKFGIEAQFEGKHRKVDPSETKKRARIKKIATSSESMLVEMAGKEGHHLSHLSLTQLDSLKNLGYLPKDINIKSYHSFEKKIVANANEIYAAQNNKSLSIPERRAEIAKLQKIDRALRKEFPNYANIKARLKVQATKLDPSGVMIKEIIDPKIAISQEAGTTLKGITPATEKGRDLLKLSKKSLEAKIQGIEKIFKERGIKLKKGQAGVIATDILKDAKKFGGKGLRLLSSEWVWPEIVIGWLDKQNNIQKGMSPERASSEMWKSVTFGLRDKGGTENAILGQAKKLGYGEKDIKALEHMMRYGKLAKEIEDTKIGIESMEKGYTPFSSEKGAQQLKEKLENLKKEQESVAGFYFGAIGDKDPKYGLDLYDQASKELMRTEWNRSLEGRKKRTDPYAGEIGSQTEEVLGMTPDWYETRKLIDAMSPEELDKWNLQERGIGYERVHPQYGAAMSGKQMEPLRDQIGYMYAEGGLAGLMKKYYD